ncbi:phosphoribosylamine--glycine ligase [Pseudoroseomonas globiformis]|uniref:Phosphoribosylamine--glycine ligase n=1 Tax=Teichococcus globiformis TaxID=2307229 RepID=A0ABV7FXE0_9PROT
MTYRSLPLLLLPVLLAACSLGGTPARHDPLSGPALTPGHAACRDEARSSSSVTEVARQRNPNNWENEQRISHELRVAELSAYRDCLRRRGLASPGGVEAVRAP